MRRDLPDQCQTASYAPVCGSGSNERLSVRLSVPSIDSSSGRFAAERPMDVEISIASCGRRHSATNADSVTLTADVGG